jgi:membrane fusion protein, multidrug efflux system
MAQSASNFARQDLARVERLRADKLATNEQLALARKALTDAQAQLDALGKTGADREQVALRAPFAGVVTSLSGNPGDRPALSSPLGTVANPDDLIVQLGLEPTDAARLSPGAPVQLMQSLDGAAAIATRLVSVGKALDPTSRLVNAVAPVPSGRGGQITLGTTLLARIELPRRQGVLIARRAVLEDAAGPFVFTVQRGTAHRQRVQLGAETDQSALTTHGLEPGTQVIVTGNAGLDDGVAVSEGKPDAATADDRADAERKP